MFTNLQLVNVWQFVTVTIFTLTLLEAGFFRLVIVISPIWFKGDENGTKKYVLSICGVSSGNEFLALNLKGTKN